MTADVDPNALPEAPEVTTAVVARSARHNAVGQVVNQSTRLLTSVVLARLLDPQDFGVVALALVMQAFLDEIKDIGMGATIIQRRTVDQVLLNSVFFANVVIGAAVSALLFRLSGSAGVWSGQRRRGTRRPGLCRHHVRDVARTDPREPVAPQHAVPCDRPGSVDDGGHQRRRVDRVCARGDDLLGAGARERGGRRHGHDHVLGLRPLAPHGARQPVGTALGVADQLAHLHGRLPDPDLGAGRQDHRQPLRGRVRARRLHARAAGGHDSHRSGQRHALRRRVLRVRASPG